MSDYFSEIPWVAFQTVSVTGCLQDPEQNSPLWYSGWKLTFREACVKFIMNSRFNPPSLDHWNNCSAVSLEPELSSPLMVFIGSHSCCLFQESACEGDIWVLTGTPLFFLLQVSGSDSSFSAINWSWASSVSRSFIMWETELEGVEENLSFDMFAGSCYVHSRPLSKAW